MKRRVNLFASLAAVASLGGFASLSYAQSCDTTSSGTDVTTDGWDHSVDTDYDGSPEPDANGGCSLGEPVFEELGTFAVNSTRRITGLVGNYMLDDRNYRDIDWIRFSVDSACYVKVTLSMSKDGVPFSFTSGTYSLLGIIQGVDGTDGTTYCNDSVDAYFDYLRGECPQVAAYTFPNGETKSTVPMPAGLHTLLITTPFDMDLFAGPIEYACDIQVLPLDNAVCGTSSNICTEVNTTPGCNDAACCDTVCVPKPECCTVAWDQDCIEQGIADCGLFVYRCNPGTGAPPNDCAGAAEFVDASLLPITFGFDASAASNDGPNDVTRLCYSNMSRDVWYLVGPLPYDGELRISMCGLGNTGDAVLHCFDIGTEPVLSSGSDLPEYYWNCTDDSCDDDDNNQVDRAGPAAINMIGVKKDHYILARIGTFIEAGQDPADPTIVGLTGSLSISFRAALFNNGLQGYLTDSTGGRWNIGFYSGYSSATNPKRWMYVPFFTTETALIDGFDFAGRIDPTEPPSVPDQINFQIIARDGASADHGVFGRPFGNGLFEASSVIAEGTTAFNGDASVDVGDTGGSRYFVSLSTPFELAPGDYYFTTYASNSEGGDSYVFWSGYARNGIPNQMLTTTDNTTATDVPTTAVVGEAFGWRTVGNVPTAIAYQTTDSAGEPYQTQAGDDPFLTYQLPFTVKGSIASACFGDIDGSGEVDNGDVAFALLDYGPCPGCSSDLDGTGEVDFGDVALILLSTGPCS